VTYQRPRSDDHSPREDVAAIVEMAFPRCRADTRSVLVAHADIRDFDAGRTVVGHGDHTRTALVLGGHVAFRRATLDGREVIPRIVSTGELAPLMPIALRPSVVEVVALSRCRVALLPSKELWALAERDAGLALDLLEHVLLTFKAVIERLDGLMYQNATRRVARVLDEHASIIFGDDAVLTRAHLPALVGTSREMTRRVLRILEADGVVARIGGSRLALLDAARLAQAAVTSPTARETDSAGPRPTLEGKTD
jgi:CRP-like cAMP-binding protein